MCGIAKIVAQVGLRSASYAVAEGGQIVAAATVGAHPAAYTIMSLSKTLQNAALWPLIASGRLDLSRPVADYLPEFSTHSKHRVTIEHVMLHTGCFASQPMPFPACRDRSVRRAAYAAWVLEGEPGRDYRYHPGNGAWVLADVATAITGRLYASLLNDDMLRALGLFGVDQLALAPTAAQGAQVRDVVMMLSESQASAAPAFRTDPLTGANPMLARLNPPCARAIGLPGSGVVGTAPALALLYQEFLTDRGDFWDRDTRIDATTRVRLHASDAAGVPLRRTLGFQSAGGARDRLGEGAFFGTTVSPATFGHEGLGGQMVWGDPDTGRSFAFLTDTITFAPGERATWMSEISTIAARL